MKDPTTVDNYYVKLSGKGNIPSELEIGRNYELKAQGTVTTKTETDNDDGSHSIYYKFEPVVIEIVTDKGEAIRAKDTRGKSQLWRSLVWKAWNKSNSQMESKDFYEAVMDRMLQHSQEIIEMYGPEAK